MGEVGGIFQGSRAFLWASVWVEVWALPAVWCREPHAHLLWWLHVSSSSVQSGHSRGCCAPASQDTELPGVVLVSLTHSLGAVLHLGV